MPVRPLRPDDADRCRAILESLPQWFGRPEANEAYIASLADAHALVAIAGDGAVVGFLAIEHHTPSSAEITVMGVDPTHHRRGHGRALTQAAIDDCRRRQVRWLHVKTRGPSTYDDDYERTRRFYQAMGFEPLYESLTEWGPDDAALVLVMRLIGD